MGNSDHGSTYMRVRGDPPQGPVNPAPHHTPPPKQVIKTRMQATPPPGVAPYKGWVPTVHPCTSFFSSHPYTLFFSSLLLLSLELSDSKVYEP